MQSLLRWRLRCGRAEDRGEGGMGNQSHLIEITFAYRVATAVAERYIVHRLVYAHQPQGFLQCLKRGIAIEIQCPARRLRQRSIEQRMRLRLIEAVIALLRRPAIRPDD